MTMAIETNLTSILERGSCKGSSIDFMPSVYDEDGYVEVPSEVKQLCGLCPVREACLDWATGHDEYGFWGGMSRYQRLQLTKKAPRAKCPGCSSEAVMSQGRGEICLSCGISWLV